jgi:hypothetical protein
MTRWTAQSKWFSFSPSAPGQIVIRLFNYPSWKVEINGRQVSPETQEDTGQMLLPVAAGENQVRITFITTPDRILGRIISGFFLLLTAWLLLRQRPGRSRAGAAA